MLRLLAFIYGKIVDLRNYLYDRGVLDIFDLGARTISIGNITTGGTGKTPLVAYVANLLAERGEKVCILTRGYGRRNAKKRVLVSDGEQILSNVDASGDEPFELAQKLLGKAIVIADADRVSAGEWAKRKFNVTAFVLDDGFQHRRVKRDVDIVCIDATDVFGGGKMLPVGRLRERIVNLRRADAIVITRSDLVDDISNLKFEISDLCNAGCVVFTAENHISEIIELEEFHAKTQRTLRKKKAAEPGTKVFAFSGIGNPANFFEMLRREGFSVMATKTFRDHHIYRQPEIVEIEKQAANAGAVALLTSSKDAVKLSNLRFEMECFVVEICVKIHDGERFAAVL